MFKANDATGTGTPHHVLPTEAPPGGSLYIQGKLLAAKHSLEEVLRSGKH